MSEPKNPEPLENPDTVFDHDDEERRYVTLDDYDVRAIGWLPSGLKGFFLISPIIGGVLLFAVPFFLIALGAAKDPVILVVGISLMWLFFFGSIAAPFLLVKK
ncbi:MAG: hypothetical protein SNJ74_04435 [Fimbriimonadaceae bacterium]